MPFKALVGVLELHVMPKATAQSPTKLHLLSCTNCCQYQAAVQIKKVSEVVWMTWNSNSQERRYSWDLELFCWQWGGLPNSELVSWYHIPPSNQFYHVVDGWCYCTCWLICVQLSLHYAKCCLFSICYFRLCFLCCFELFLEVQNWNSFVNSYNPKIFTTIKVDLQSVQWHSEHQDTQIQDDEH